MPLADMPEVLPAPVPGVSAEPGALLFVSIVLDVVAVPLFHPLVELLVEPEELAFAEALPFI